MALKKALKALESVRESVTRDGVLADLEVDDSRESMIWSLATWAGVAMFMVMLAVLASRTEIGSDRLAAIADGRAYRTASATQVEKVAVDPMVTYETRRLADAIRVLGTERDQLASRLEMLERSVGDVTASIGRQSEAMPRSPSRVIDPRVSIQPMPQPAADIAALAPPASTSDNALDTPVLKTEFAVDLVGDMSLEALRARWAQLRAQYGPLLEGLRPLVVVKEGNRAGSMELRLVAGPLSNANTAARLCATLSSAGQECKPTVFDGQRLAVR